MWLHDKYENPCFCLIQTGMQAQMYAHVSFFLFLCCLRLQQLWLPTVFQIAGQWVQRFFTRLFPRCGFTRTRDEHGACQFSVRQGSTTESEASESLWSSRRSRMTGCVGSRCGLAPNAAAAGLSFLPPSPQQPSHHCTEWCQTVRDAGCWRRAQRQQATEISPPPPIPPQIKQQD